LNTYWVYENIKEDHSFYNKLDILLLLCSGFLWKKHHPNFTTHLTADKLTLNYLKSFNGLSIFDKVDEVPKNSYVDKSVFWASSKVEKLRYIEGPSIIMDHDFLVFKSFEKYLKDKPFFCHEENGHGYYDTAWNPFVKSINDLVSRPKPHAINCCFLYLPDHKFANAYSKTSIELMERFTKLNAPNSRFLVFAEQLLLKHLLDFHNIEYNTLLNEKWNAKGKYFEPSDRGHISFDNSQTTYRHYWMDKPLIRESKESFDLNQEIAILYNILKKSKVDIKKLNDVS
jgi:hypothetical protein